MNQVPPSCVGRQSLKQEWFRVSGCERWMRRCLVLKSRAKLKVGGRWGWIPQHIANERGDWSVCELEYLNLSASQTSCVCFWGSPPEYSQSIDLQEGFKSHQRTTSRAVSKAFFLTFPLQSLGNFSLGTEPLWDGKTPSPERRMTPCVPCMTQCWGAWGRGKRRRKKHTQSRTCSVNKFVV